MFALVNLANMVCADFGPVSPTSILHIDTCAFVLLFVIFLRNFTAYVCNF